MGDIDCGGCDCGDCGDCDCGDCGDCTDCGDCDICNCGDCCKDCECVGFHGCCGDGSGCHCCECNGCCSDDGGGDVGHHFASHWWLCFLGDSCDGCCNQRRRREPPDVYVVNAAPVLTPSSVVTAQPPSYEEACGNAVTSQPMKS
uniref:Uncharacterized protein n=2 Tax=Magallana gigas TaxID=29159 RepID=A0A8W8M5J0_MAGGI|nr:keratin-associated protein 5-5-like [Crassostrea gigas]